MYLAEWNTTAAAPDKNMGAPEDGIGRLLHTSEELRHHLHHAVQLLLPLRRWRIHARIELGLCNGTAPSLTTPASGTSITCGVLQLMPARSHSCVVNRSDGQQHRRPMMTSVHLRLADDLQGAGGAGVVDGDAHAGAVLQAAAQHRDVHIHNGGSRLRRPPPQPRQRVADRPPAAGTPKTVSDLSLSHGAARRVLTPVLLPLGLHADSCSRTASAAQHAHRLLMVAPSSEVPPDCLSPAIGASFGKKRAMLLGPGSDGDGSVPPAYDRHWNIEHEAQLAV